MTIANNQQHIERIAKVCHEANRAYCAALGDLSQSKWEDAPAWQKESAINGVRFHIANPAATPENSHESWLAQKEKEGWKYGPVKDAEKKEHPCFLPYGDLPQEQRAKDHIFRSIIHAMHTETILMGAENHSGWKLEELLDQLRKEVAAKTEKIQHDTSVVAVKVRHNNKAIIDNLETAAWCQRNSFQALEKVGPNQGPAGKPRIGGTS